MVKQIALVTGGTGEIGEAISIKLHDAGYRTIVTYSPKNMGIDAWLAHMETQKRVFHAYAVDVADYESCERCVARILAEVGPIDILVNNAGITRDAVFKKLDKVDWDAVIRTNLDSVFNMTKPVCDGMVERGWGRIRQYIFDHRFQGVVSARPITRRRRLGCMDSRSRWRLRWQERG